MPPETHPLAAAAAALIGTPYRPGSEHPAAGVDCGGFVHAALRGAGLTPPSLPAVRPTRDRESIIALLEQLAAPVTERAPGDIALFVLGSAGICHLGICADGDTLLHVHRRIGVCRESFDAGWQRRLQGLYRLNDKK